MQWQPFYHPAIYLLAVLASVALIAAAVRIAVSAKSRRWPLLVLRALVLAGLITLLFNPIDRRETVLPPRPPSVAMLVDCSQSMTLGGREPRIEGVKRSIQRAAAMLPTDSSRVDLFRFGRRLAKVPSLAELTAVDDASELGEALDRLPSRLAGDLPQAVIVFSDGAIADNDSLDEIAAAYHDLGVPLHAFSPSEDEVRGDVAITELALPETVGAGDEAIVRAVIRSRGFDGQRVLVTIRPADRPNAAPLATLPITLRDGATPCEIPVIAEPSHGKLVLQVPLSDGEAVPSNNEVPFRLMQRDRRLNVLYMEGTANSEYRWLRDALQEDTDIRCVSLIVNNQYAARPRLQRVEDPYRGFPATRGELFEFDVVICSDIPKGAFTPEQIDWTVELIDRRGGGFAMVGGHTSFGSGGWDQTPWEELIPFDMTGRRDYLAQSFQVEIPPSAQSHPIWKIVDDAEKNVGILKSMPRFDGTNLISRVKPAATLLGQTSSPLSRVGVMPVFACETFGRGRTFAMSTDTTEWWGRFFERNWGVGDNRYYRKFWRNVVRWLSENSRASQNRLLLRTDQVVYSPGEPIRITAETLDDDYRPTSDYRLTTELLVSARDADNEPTLASQTEQASWQVVASEGRFVGTLPAVLPRDSDDQSQPMQSFRLVVSAWDSNEQLVASEDVELQLLHDSSEWLDPQPRPDTLRQLAESGGGRLLESERELTDVLESFEIPPGDVLVHTLPLWDHPALWLLFIGLLATEWTLRRRWN